MSTIQLPCPIPDYKKVLADTRGLLSQVTAAYKSEDWASAHALIREIAKLHIPTDEYYQDRVCNLLCNAMSEAYFAGLNDQADKHHEERLAELEKR